MTKLQLKNVFILVLAATITFPLVARERNNILIIMADDCTHNDLPIYGGQNAKTPNLDLLAKQGLVFNRAYLCSAMCQPCRAELYSGLFPMRNGCAWNHAASRPTIRSLPHYLSNLGYRVGLAGKVHVLPPTAYPFEPVKGFDGNCVRNPTMPHELSNVQEFIRRDESPFCLVVALVEPHVPWVMGDASKYPPSQIKLPANIADTPQTRSDYSNYLAEITYMDQQVGELLEVLQSTGKADNTLVLFTSEQGAQFPGCKWTNYDTGLHTAMIVRWPSEVPAGLRTDALVHYADVVPTLIETAGGTTQDLNLDGISFSKVLRDPTATHRNYAFGMHNNYPEGPPYPIRSVCDGRYHYIRNLTPDEVFIEKHLMGINGNGELNNAYWATWVWDASSDAHTYQLVKRYTHRPAEELYDLQSDPFELDNLVANEKLNSVRKRLSQELDRWMTSQGDPGVAEDTPESHQAAKQGLHRFGK